MPTHLMFPSKALVMRFCSCVLSCGVLAAMLAGCTQSAQQAENGGQTMGSVVKIGWSEVDITPPWAMPLVGQNYIRIAKSEEAHDRLTATAMAIESSSGGQAVFVSLDLVGAYDLGLHLRQYVAEQPADARLAGLDLNHLVLFATHTHTGPYLSNKKGIPDGIHNGEDYRKFLWPKLADLIARAWDSREPSSLATTQAQCAVGFNRIALYEDGRAKMYGNTSKPDFVRMEGPVDHTAELLYTWDQAGTLTGVIINIAAPSQVLEAKRYFSADYWHEVRRQLREHAAIPDDVHVLAMCGAAGDQSPRDLENHELTRDDTHGHAGTQTIGKLVVQAVTDALPQAQQRQDSHAVVAHSIRSFDLPRKPERGDEPFPVTLHAVRISDIAVVDNPFELYTAYGLEIKDRSAARQTFIAQLASGPAYGMYLPTPEAIPGGGYGSRIKNGQVGPDGGRILVDKTVELIDTLFTDDTTP